VQSSVLTLRFLPGKLDVRLVSVKSNILSHEYSVHDYRAQHNIGFLASFAQAGATLRHKLASCQFNSRILSLPKTAFRSK
jgi:hypothetical protein